MPVKNTSTSSKRIRALVRWSRPGSLVPNRVRAVCRRGRGGFAADRVQPGTRGMRERKLWISGDCVVEGSRPKPKGASLILEEAYRTMHGRRRGSWSSRPSLGHSPKATVDRSRTCEVHPLRHEGPDFLSCAG